MVTPMRRRLVVWFDDAVLGQLDELAQRMGARRSELIRHGIGELLNRSDGEAVRDMIAAYTRWPQDPAWAESSERTASDCWE
jgi:metal-responsive CopG/Arc/MetJ family transcriptional regulator